MTQAATAETLKVYLPRQVSIDDEIMLLGDIAIIRGSAADIAKASKIQMGKFSAAGQKITVSRRSILSRLAANKINTKNVSFSGAKEFIKVGRNEMTISKSDIAKQATKFLEDNNSNPAIAYYKLTRSPAGIVLPAQKAKVTFAPRFGSRISSSQTTVEVDVLVDGKKVGTNQVTYRPMYNCRKVTAKMNVPAGTVISSRNIKIETIASKYPEHKGWKSPIGLLAKRDIKSGQLIRSSLLTKVKPEILIKRNAIIPIKIQTSVFSITVNGLAMKDGAFGEIIRVKNVESKKIIFCKVNFDGSVSPVM